ncbi:MAG: 16S rRNA (adenine(1518)-N(6)/adenine(1519)-N(6))-dimethyltransferase RsmA [Eubacterium sp.]|nr:16S rRNA (adenine(1518)-N(6)/adenine(1519)-N(6))-dimethyltransferase RsmA [Eubacterium sp.]
MIPDNEKLSNPQVTIAAIKKYGFNFQKKFGQNFLIDDHVINKIIKAADITKDDIVVEIGPGMGTLTQYLAESAGQVIAVEIDTKLLPILAETLAPYDNVTVINNDILKCDIEELVNEVKEKKGFDYKAVKVVANLPYYITTPIIMGLFEKHVPAESITVMVQKEVADRMNAAPGGKDYGALSLAVQYYSETYIAANVPPNCFIPRPGVGSAVIRLTKHDKAPVEVKDEALMFRLIHASFEQRRKTLKNGISNAGLPGITKEAVGEALISMGLDENIRGERLSLAEFAQLADILYDACE